MPFVCTSEGRLLLGVKGAYMDLVSLMFMSHFLNQICKGYGGVKTLMYLC